MTKTHMNQGNGYPLCHARGARPRLATNPSRVDCYSCQGNKAFDSFAEAWRVKEDARIDANPALPVHNSWDYSVLIECKGCGHGLFKEAGRSLFDNYHKCAKCGKIASTPTETYMCM